MKKIILFIPIIFCSVFAFDANAQMTKKEAKELKKRIKKLKPEQYKQLLNENKSLKAQLSTVKAELSNIDSKIVEKDQEILSCQTQVNDLRGELSASQSSKSTPSKPSKRRVLKKDPNSIDETKGVLFKVQLGAFRKKDLKKYDTSSNFGVEDENGVQKYTIGVFRVYWDADAFKKHLRQMGVKDAWVVAYKEGVRVPVKDVLQGVNKQ